MVWFCPAALLLNDVTAIELYSLADLQKAASVQALLADFFGENCAEKNEKNSDQL